MGGGGYHIYIYIYMYIYIYIFHTIMMIMNITSYRKVSRKDSDMNTAVIQQMLVTSEGRTNPPMAADSGGHTTKAEVVQPEAAPATENRTIPKTLSSSSCADATMEVGSGPSKPPQTPQVPVCVCVCMPCQKILAEVLSLNCGPPPSCASPRLPSSALPSPKKKKAEHAQASR